MNARNWLVIAALIGALGVTLGAFGAHGLPNFLKPQALDEVELARRVANWETAAKYQMYHALALIGVAWVVSRGGGNWSSASGWLLIAGTAIFSGCLYVLVLSGMKWLGGIVPIGGLLLIAGWLTLAIAAWRAPSL